MELNSSLRKLILNYLGMFLVKKNSIIKLPITNLTQDKHIENVDNQSPLSVIFVFLLFIFHGPEVCLVVSYLVFLPNFSGIRGIERTLHKCRNCIF